MLLALPASLPQTLDLSAVLSRSNKVWQRSSKATLDSISYVPAGMRVAWMETPLRGLEAHIEDGQVAILFTRAKGRSRVDIDVGTRQVVETFRNEDELVTLDFRRSSVFRTRRRSKNERAPLFALQTPHLSLDSHAGLKMLAAGNP